MNTTKQLAVAVHKLLMLLILCQNVLVLPHSLLEELLQKAL